MSRGADTPVTTGAPDALVITHRREILRVFARTTPKE
jgi:hypothetical protein